MNELCYHEWWVHVQGGLQFEKPLGGQTYVLKQCLQHLTSAKEASTPCPVRQDFEFPCHESGCWWNIDKYISRLTVNKNGKTINLVDHPKIQIPWCKEMSIPSMRPGECCIPSSASNALYGSLGTGLQRNWFEMEHDGSIYSYLKILILCLQKRLMVYCLFW